MVLIQLKDAGAAQAVPFSAGEPAGAGSGSGRIAQLHAVVVTPADGGTRVTWQMTGENTGLAKVFAIFVNMDKVVGGAYERGLASLSAAATADKA